MNKNSIETICPINQIRVLGTFVEYPQKAMTIDDLLYKRGLRGETNEKQVRKAIDGLIGKKILKEIRPWGTPPKNKNKKKAANYDKRYSYEISKTVYAFKQVLNFVPTMDINKLLASDYSNIIIEENGFEKIYEAIKSHLLLPEFKQFASDSLLHHHAAEDEYAHLARDLQTKILTSYSRSASNTENEPEHIKASRFLAELGQELSTSSIKLIEILSGFDPLKAVRFYRKTLHPSILNAYDELAEKNIITKGLRNFLAFDNHLSPLTAHPYNSILKILFANPFERIYEDAYLLDGENFWVLSGRAAAVYNNFPDFIFEYLKYNYIKPENWDIFIKEMIYSWNVASTRFDMVYYYLGELYNDKIGSGNYHLKRDGLTFNIVDLISGKSLLDPLISSSLLLFGSVPLIFEPDQENEKHLRSELMKDPFTSLRQCHAFDSAPWRAEIWRPEISNFDDIFSDLENKIETNN
jgi:hypothetical protein